jgi:hypothetical protein
VLASNLPIRVPCHQTGALAAVLQRANDRRFEAEILCFNCNSLFFNYDCKMVVDGSLLGSGTCKASLLLDGQNIGDWRCRLLRRMSPLVAHLADMGNLPDVRFAPQPLMDLCTVLQSGFNRIKTNSTGITARVVQRLIAARAAAFPTVAYSYTSSFQYSLTSYLRTSSTQVVSTPCRGMSRL